MDLRARFEIGKMFTVADIGAAIPEDGLVKINKWMDAKWNRTLPPMFDFRWMSNSGAFPRRVSKWLHEQGIKMSDYEKESLGNLVRTFTFKKSAYTYEFTNDLNWKSGGFGDSGSCFWNGKQWARTVMTHNGCLAVRFYEDGLGWGRAWIVFSPKHPKLIFVINAYPKSFGLDQAALVLSLHLNMKYKPVSLVNNGTWKDGTLWINQGRGIVMWDREEPNDHLDLLLPDEVQCVHCKRWFNDGVRFAPDSRLACSACFDKLYFICDYCSRAGDGKGNVSGRCKLCDNCFRDHTLECGLCEMRVLKEHAHSTKKGRLCSACYNREYAECANCDEVVERAGATEIHGSMYCERCYDKYYFTCPECGEARKRSCECKTAEGLTICSTCSANRYRTCRACGMKYEKKLGRCLCRPKGEKQPEYAIFVSTQDPLVWRVDL